MLVGATCAVGKGSLCQTQVTVRSSDDLSGFLRFPASSSWSNSVAAGFSVEVAGQFTTS